MFYLIFLSISNLIFVSVEFSVDSSMSMNVGSKLIYLWFRFIQAASIHIVRGSSGQQITVQEQQQPKKNIYFEWNKILMKHQLFVVLQQSHTL